MTELNGFRVLVTGATSGLGAAMATALAKAGARVMVTGRDRARAEETAKELGSSVIPSELDVRDERSVAACIARAREAWGGIDTLVNNAAIGMRTVNPSFMSEPQPFWEVTPAGFRDVVETKVLGCFLMARAVVPLMLREGGGRIVNISRGCYEL
jgi:NAD(P)-dependent dehydrogenase (short-subunit alcohol dehydrogenase family)